MAGKVKKGMPGFSEFGTAVDVQISVLMNALLEILNMRVEDSDKSNLNSAFNAS